MMPIQVLEFGGSKYLNGATKTNKQIVPIIGKTKKQNKHDRKINE